MEWLVVLNAAGGLVLVLAGLGKLRSPEPVAAALSSLRLPSGQLAIGVVAGAEIGIGIAGALAGGSPMAWVVAGEWALLALVALVLLRRPQVPCGCFGAADERVGVVHVLVDVAFAGVAVGTALAADESLSEAADVARGGWGGVVAAAVLLALAVRYLLSAGTKTTESSPLASGPALEWAPEPDVDAVVDDVPVEAVAQQRLAPERSDPEPRVLVGVTPDGSPIELDLIGHARPTLLAFLTDTCVTCREFWAAFGDGATPPGIDVVIVTMGPEDESVELITRLAPRGLPTVMSSSAWDAYGIAAGPYFVLVGRDGAVVTHGPASTVASLDAMLTDAG